jgi:hypothetical protein
MPRVGFEPTIPVFERVKTVYALDRQDSVIGLSFTVTFKSELLYINGIVIRESNRSVSDLFQCTYGNILTPELSLLYKV